MACGKFAVVPFLLAMQLFSWLLAMVTVMLVTVARVSLQQ